MENEIIEHKIDVDDYMSVTLKIPKVLNAVEFAGLMEKSKKLLNLSVTPVLNRTVRKPKQIGENRRSYTEFTPEMIKDIKHGLTRSRLSYAKLAERINKKYGTNIKEKALYMRIRKMKQNKMW